MESTDSSTGSQHHQPNLPPGFRFHPTDEELVVHYLKKKASSAPLPVAIIAEVDLYKFDPWELPAKATFGEQEWYFFSPRDRKYPNGARPNRAATSGYWKATGTDKPVLTSGGTQKVGVKKALVFYGGKPPKGIKTNWIMHEYRLADNRVSNKPPCCDLGNKKNSLRLDDWVLCRIYKKNNTQRGIDHDKDDSLDEMLLRQIPPSMMIGGGGNQKLLHNFPPKGGTTTTTNYATFLENDHHSNLFEGLISSSTHHDGSSSSLKQTTLMPMDSLKRTLNWTTEDDGGGGGSGSSLLNKRFHGESSDDHQNGSIASLLSQLPQTPPLHQQAMLAGSLYQLPGMNWYS